MVIMNNWKARLRALNPCPEAYEWAIKHKTLREAWRRCERGDWMYWLWEKCGGRKYALGAILDEVLRWGEDDLWNISLNTDTNPFEAYIILDFMPDPPELPE